MSGVDDIDFDIGLNQDFSFLRFSALICIRLRYTSGSAFSK